jgi:hypothetical protein
MWPVKHDSRANCYRGEQHCCERLKQEVQAGPRAKLASEDRSRSVAVGLARLTRRARRGQEPEQPGQTKKLRLTWPPRAMR